jgi:hypothetical protein
LKISLSLFFRGDKSTPRFLSVKACGFQLALFFSSRKKREVTRSASGGAKIAPAIFEFILSLFFFLKEKEAKRIKNPCRIYRLRQC